MLDQDAIEKEQQGGENQWLNSLSLDGHYLQTLLSTLQRMSHRTDLTNVSAPTRKLPRCSNLLRDLFSTQLTAASILKKPEIRKPIRVMDPPAPPLTKTTFQQQGTSAVQDKNRSQSPINNSRNRSAENRIRSTENHTKFLQVGTENLYTPPPILGSQNPSNLRL